MTAVYSTDDLVIGATIEHTNSRRRGRIRDIRRCRDGTTEFQVNIDCINYDVWWSSRHVRRVDVNVDVSERAAGGGDVGAVAPSDLLDDLLSVTRRVGNLESDVRRLEADLAHARRIGGRDHDAQYRKLGEVLVQYRAELRGADLQLVQARRALLGLLHAPSPQVDAVPIPTSIHPRSQQRAPDQAVRDRPRRRGPRIRRRR